MTPEQIEELNLLRLPDVINWLNDNEDFDLAGDVEKAVKAITQLQEQVTELENHNKDKSQLLANYAEQIKELVKQKYRGEK